MAIVVPCIKRGFLQPEEPWEFGPQSSWSPEWTGSISTQVRTEFKPTMSQFKPWLPYVLAGLILMVSRIPELGIKAWLLGFKLSFVDILGYKGVSASLNYLYLPGTVPFMLVGLLTIGLHGMSGESAKCAWLTTFSKMKGPTIALVSAVALVAIYRGTGSNPEGLPSMPLAMAKTVAAMAGHLWPFLDAFVGGLGAFITGSNTVSNLLFSEFQWQVADALQISRVLTIAAQVVGGAAGNMICVHNIVAVCAVVGLIGHEGAILRKTFWPFLLYCVVVGVFASYLIYFANLGLY